MATADAQIAKGIPDEAEIESMIQSDNAGGMYPAFARADLLVRAENVENGNRCASTTAPLVKLTNHPAVFRRRRAFDQ